MMSENLRAFVDETRLGVLTTFRRGGGAQMSITGSNFESGANIIFENGRGHTPGASNVVVVDDNTITATITTKKGGPLVE